MLDPFGVPHFGVAQEPSYELNPVKQVLPGGKTLWDQTI